MKKRYLYFIILGLFILFTHIFYFSETLVITYKKIRRIEIAENKRIKYENFVLREGMRLKKEFEKKIAIIERNRPNIGGDLWEIYEAILDNNIDGLKDRISGLPDTQEMIRHTEKVMSCGLGEYKWKMLGFNYPVTKNSFITSEYGKNHIWLYSREEKKYYIKSRTHRGIDIASDIDLSIYSTYGGVVFAIIKDDAQLGNCIIIKHEYNGESIISVYAHLSEVYVKEGSLVKIYIGEDGEIDEKNSTLIGLVGTKGFTTGRHLHFEVWKYEGSKRGWVTFNPVRNSKHGSEVYAENYKSYVIYLLKKLGKEIH